MVKTETPLSPLSVFTASRVPVSSAAPGWVKKKTTTSPRASALIAGSVLDTSAATDGLAGLAGGAGFGCGGAAAGGGGLSAVRACAAGGGLLALGLFAPVGPGGGGGV